MATEQIVIVGAGGSRLHPRPTTGTPWDSQHRRGTAHRHATAPPRRARRQRPHVGDLERGLTDAGTRPRGDHPPSIDTVNIIRWCTDVHAAPLGEIDLLSEPEQLAEVRSHSPFLISHIGQHLLMPALWKALEGEALIDFRRGWHAVMTADQLSLQSPDAMPQNETPRYIIAADGANSSLREAADIAMTGPVLANMGSVFFHAPELYADGADRPLLSWIYHPPASAES